MLSLLVDENISPEVRYQIKVQSPEVLIFSVFTWQDARFKAQPDELILEAVSVQGLALVTFDQKTILPLLSRMGQSGINHSGVIFADQRSIRSNNIGLLCRSLLDLWSRCKNDDWTNRVEYLRATV